MTTEVGKPHESLEPCSGQALSCQLHRMSPSQGRPMILRSALRHWALAGGGRRAHAESGEGRSTIDGLVWVQWLAEHLDDPELRVFDATVQVTRRIWLPTIRSGRREWRREQHPRKCVRGPVQPVGPGPAEEVPHHANRGLVRGKGGGTGHRRRQPTRRHLRRRPARVVRRSAPTARDRPIARCSTTKAYAPTRYDLGRKTPGGGSYAADDAVGADHDNPRGPTLCHATVRPRPAPRPV